jgi:hypothetical protein
MSPQKILANRLTQNMYTNELNHINTNSNNLPNVLENAYGYSN